MACPTVPTPGRHLWRHHHRRRHARPTLFTGTPSATTPTTATQSPSSPHRLNTTTIQSPQGKESRRSTLGHSVDRRHLLRVDSETFEVRWASNTVAQRRLAGDDITEAWTQIHRRAAVAEALSRHDHPRYHLRGVTKTEPSKPPDSIWAKATSTARPGPHRPLYRQRRKGPVVSAGPGSMSRSHRGSTHNPPRHSVPPERGGPSST